MFPIRTTLIALLLVSAGAMAAGSDDKPTPAAATPAPEQNKITKSRSNIQNNREAPASPTATEPTTEGQAQGVVKTKTKSNQSND